MFALAFALVLLVLPASQVETCARTAELRDDVVDASRASARGESLQALADRMRLERAEAPQSSCAPDLLRTEALSYLFLGEHVEALALMDRLLSDYPRLDPETEGKTHTNRGYLLARLGRTAESALAYAAAAEFAEDVDPALGSRFLMEASKTYRLLRRPEAATAYLQAASAIADTLGDTNLQARVLTEHALLNRADATSALPAGQRDSLAQVSLDYAYRAASLYGDDPSADFQAFHTLILIAEAHLQLGETRRAEAAIGAAEDLLPRVSSLNLQSGPRLAQLAGLLAEKKGELETAERHYQRSLREARQIGDAQLQLEALRFLGNLASRTDLDRAGRLYRQATGIAEDRRASMGLQDWSVSAFETYQLPYRLLVRTLLQQGNPEEAFAQLDAIRARYLRDLRASAALRRTLGPEQQQALTDLSDQLRDERAALADPNLSSSERARHEHAAAQIQIDIEALSGARPAPPRPLDLHALQSALGRREQHLVTYFLDDVQPVAFVVRADTFAVRPLPAGLDELRRAVDGMDAFWRHRAPPLDALHHLYTLTVAPIADLLPAGDPVVVVPEGPLSAIPFALLVDAPSERFGYDDAPFLLRRHPISTELAASLVVESGAPANRPLSDRPFVAFGRSRFDGAPRSLRGSVELGPLPYVPEELERVVAELAGGESYLDEDATENAFDASLSAPRLLHLATHVLPDAELPLYSHAVLWDDPDASDDGILHAYEIEDRLLDLDLVVLSGCETGRGVGRRGEGMQSLQYAFRAAGARSVVATLWQVDDRATAYVMDRFYHHLGRGARKDVALQRAQLDYLDAHSGALASPALWAAAVLYGDPSPLDWTDDRGGALGWVLFGLGALALAALPLAYRRRRARLQRA